MENSIMKRYGAQVKLQGKELRDFKGIRLNDESLKHISINVEDAAIDFGWTTVSKSGNAVVRWARVNGYLNEFGFPNKLGKKGRLFIYNLLKAEGILPVIEQERQGA